MGKNKKRNKTTDDDKVKKTLNKRIKFPDDPIEENLHSAGSSETNKQNELNIKNDRFAIATEAKNKDLQVLKIKQSQINKGANDKKTTKNKKIKFCVDESEGEVQSKIKTVAKKKLLNDDDAEVKDEDIDKFCEELDEEDNQQYENWVKLIEANFNSNKKKT